jgi:hypothetical protein
MATQKSVAKMYFEDGSVVHACPPLKALLHIMWFDHWEGRGLDHPEVRRLFTREYLLPSDWYAARLQAKQAIDRQLWRRHVNYLERFLKKASHADEAERLGIGARLNHARKKLEEAESPAGLEKLSGTLGAEPIAQYVGNATTFAPSNSSPGREPSLGTHKS